MSIDLSILHFFNQSLACSAGDTLSLILTNVRYWYPVYALAGIYLIYRYRLRGVYLVLAAIVLVTITDSLAHYLIKPMVGRVRPCAVVSWIRLPDGARFDPSFPSNHAMNNVAIATFFSLTFRRRGVTTVLFTLATLISLGRVYQGVHYPSDVAGGAIIGAALGYFIAFLFRRIFAEPDGIASSLHRHSHQ